MTTTESQPDFRPALVNEAMIPVYDVLHHISRLSAVHEALVRNAALDPGTRVLDIGCGTGSLLIRAGLAQPRADLIGVDPDERMLGSARAKALRAGVPIRFDRGYGEALPLADGSVDRVFSTLMLHHMDGADGQARLLAEVRRVLAPGGVLLLADVDNHGLIGADDPTDHSPAAHGGHGDHAGHGHGHGGEAGHGHGHGAHGGGPLAVLNTLVGFAKMGLNRPNPTSAEAQRFSDHLAATIAKAGFDTRIIGRRGVLMGNATLVAATARP